MNKIYEIYEMRARDKMEVHPGADSGVWECAESFLLATEKLFIGKSVRSLETGLGLSTAVFCNLGFEHTSIVPSVNEKNELLNWMHRNNISTDKLEILVDFSYALAPSTSLNGEFDLVFIDGNHGFPHPFIDYFYLSQKLKIGGYLAIDDIQLEIPGFLFEKIKKKPYWKVIEEESKWCILQLTQKNLVAIEDWTS
jgi:Methyltransferase domain